MLPRRRPACPQWAHGSRVTMIWCCFFSHSASPMVAHCNAGCRWWGEISARSSPLGWRWIVFYIFYIHTHTLLHNSKWINQGEMRNVKWDSPNKIHRVWCSCFECFSFRKNVNHRKQSIEKEVQNKSKTKMKAVTGCAWSFLRNPNRREDRNIERVLSSVHCKMRCCGPVVVGLLDGSTVCFASGKMFPIQSLHPTSPYRRWGVVFLFFYNSTLGIEGWTVFRTRDRINWEAIVASVPPALSSPVPAGWSAERREI